MIKKAKMRIDEKMLRKSLLYTLIWGLIAHGYCFLNLMVSHDSVNDFYLARQWPKAGFGRFFYGIYISITRGRLVLPWLIGVFSILWVGLAVYLIVCMFDIHSSGIVLLVAGICMTNPTVYALAATYIHDLDADLFAMLLSVAAAYLWYRGLEDTCRKEKCLSCMAASILISILLGIYQSYISVTITLLILLSMKKILYGEKFFKVLFQGLLGIVILAFGGGLYFIEAKVFESVTGTNVLGNQSYNGLGNLSQSLTGNFFAQVSVAYKGVMDAMKNLITTSYCPKLFLFSQGILAISVGLLVMLALKKVEWKNKILLIVLGIVMPFGMNISYFLGNGVGHILMQYAVWLIYLLALVLVLWMYEEPARLGIKSIIYPIVCGCVFISLVGNVQTANAVYVKKDLEYQSTLSYMTRVLDKIEEHAEYIPGETPVLIVGENAIGKTRNGLEKYTVITGASATAPITFYDTYEAYFEYVLGTDISLTNDNDMKDDERVQKMPVFPKEGSIQMLDGIMVVKLAED